MLYPLSYEGSGDERSRCVIGWTPRNRPVTEEARR